jgi:hypothetical protein
MLGVLTISLGACIALGRAPVPAWRWVCTSVSAPGAPQGLATCLLGAIAVAWSLMAAAGAGYVWGWVGLSLLVLVCVLLTPLARRWPTRLDWRRAVVAHPQQSPDVTPDDNSSD